MHLLSSFTDDIGLRRESIGSALPKIPIIRFRWGDGFAAPLVRCSLRPIELLAPLTDLTRHFAQPTGTFTPELPASRSPFSSSGITTVATEHFHRWDFHPLERQLASLHGLFHPLQHAGLSRRTPVCPSLGNNYPGARDVHIWVWRFVIKEFVSCFGQKKQSAASSRRACQLGAGIRDHRASRRGQDRVMPTRDYCTQPLEPV